MPSRAATVEALVAGRDRRRTARDDRRAAGRRAGAAAASTTGRCSRTRTSSRWCAPRRSTAGGTELRTALDAVSARLTTDDLVRLNRAVELDGLTPAEAAARWWSSAD